MNKYAITNISIYLIYPEFFKIKYNQYKLVRQDIDITIYFLIILTCFFIFNTSQNI